MGTIRFAIDSPGPQGGASSPSPITRKSLNDPDGVSAQSNKAVLVADQKLSFNDVLMNRLPVPFDWQSFRRIAIEKFLVEENIRFVEDYRQVFHSSDTGVPVQESPESCDELLRTSKEWYNKYLKSGAEWELNVPSSVRKTTVESLPKNWEANVQKLTECLTRAWGPIYNHVLKMLQTDIFPKWTRLASVQRNVSLSRRIAMWWQHGVTLQEFFTFPNPIDKAEARCHALCSTLLAVTSILLDAFTKWWYLMIPLTYGFLARTICGPRLDPQAFLVLFVLRPIATGTGLLVHEFVPGPPRRFAQFVGLCFTSTALVCRVLNYEVVAWVLIGVLVLFSSVLVALDICAACLIFGLAMRLGILPESVCESCSVHYVDGGKKGAQSGP